MICDNINMNKSKMILNVNKTNIYTFKFEGYFLKILKKKFKNFLFIFIFFFVIRKKNNIFFMII